MSVGAKNRRRGFSHERDLASRLWRLGFAVMRAPASGSKAKRMVYPDLVAMWRGRIFAFEVKTAKQPRIIYVPKHQVDKLLEFSKRSGAVPFIAVKIINHTGWRFVKLEMLEKTSSNNYRITLEIINKALKMRDLMALCIKHKTII